MFRPRNILEPDERLLLTSVSTKAVYFWCGIFVLAMFWEVARAVLQLLPLNSRLDPWMVAVTDRRVLVRKRLFSNYYDDIDLSEIEQVEHDWQASKLFLVGQEHALEIRCSEKEAAEILKALDGAYNPPKTFWQRLRRLW